MKRFTPGMLILFAAVSSGCNDDQMGIQKRTANRPPETTLVSGPPDSSSGVNYKVPLWWSGSDTDGTVDHYDFIMVDHPAAKDNIDGSGSETVVIDIPKPDDSRWISTTATDSVFIASADTLRHDPQPSDSTGTPDEIRDLLWERWHTFFIRAVDDRGAVDSTPDYRSFNATNIAPQAWLTDPVLPGRTFEGRPAIILRWDGQDPVGGGDRIDPVASRWVIIDSQIDSSKRPLSYPDSLYVLPDRFQWSPWARWDAADQTGRQAIIHNLQSARSLPDGRVQGYYVFAVQVMDEAGAISPVFDKDTPLKNNATAIRITNTLGPLLTVQERALGISQFLGGALPVQIDVAAGQPLSFAWAADASRYGGDIKDYRYAWDLRNYDDDDEWDQDWCASCKHARPRSFNAGTHVFYLQVRDNVGGITEATFRLLVTEMTRSRDVLWVDDTQPIIHGSGQEEREDERWLKLMSELASEHNFDFNPAVDVWDVETNRNPPVSKIFDYKSIIWSVRASRSRTALERLAKFVDPFLDKNRNTVHSFNYLKAYLKNDGRLWIYGEQVAKQLWTDLTTRQQERAVNVTNWDDDPSEQHPTIDSVGTLSLLYEMGVEMFDCGGGTGCGTRATPRRTVQHFCYGLDRAVLPGDAVQRFDTDVYAAAPHSHQVNIPTSDVDAAGGGNDVTYETYGQIADHNHLMTVTNDDFQELRMGNTITVATEVATTPEPHMHDVELVDQVGLWGLPILVPGADWSPAPPATWRPNIEIYNMPGAMFAQQPHLRPRLGVSRVIYTYVSGVKQDPSRGIFYPLTADKEAVALLAKGAPSDPFFSRAICGFEPERLTPESHKNLVEYILVRNFRAGFSDVP